MIRKHDGFFLKIYIHHNLLRVVILVPSVLFVQGRGFIGRLQSVFVPIDSHRNSFIMFDESWKFHLSQRLGLDSAS